jgi:hypothetical protein
MSADEYFHTRFAYDLRRDVLWRTLWRCHFSRLVAPRDRVLELGAGYGSFINNVTAARRIAVDAWPGMLTHLAPGVEGHVGNVTDLSFLEPESVNFAFASNLFEHITQRDFTCVLSQLRTALHSDGTLNILQPNFYYAYRKYFDDYTHVAIYSHTSLCDFLEAHGFAVIECRSRFLPLTIKSVLPVSSTLIRMYLASPWKPLGKQMFIRAKVRR